MRVSEIRVNQIRVNQGLGVSSKEELGIVSREMKNEKITVSTSIESIQCAKGLYLHRCEQSMIALIYLSDSYNGMFPSFWSCPKSFKITL